MVISKPFIILFILTHFHKSILYSQETGQFLILSWTLTTTCKVDGIIWNIIVNEAIDKLIFFSMDILFFKKKTQFTILNVKKILNKGYC